jgi:hypothetical protein
MIGRTSRLGAHDAVGGVGPAGALTTSKGFDPSSGRTSENLKDEVRSIHLLGTDVKIRPPPGGASSLKSLMFVL